MANFPTPENYPKIYWLGLGEYGELTEICQEKYGTVPQEGQSTEEFVQILRDEGNAIPDEPTPIPICERDIEWRTNQLKYLLSLLKDNDCEPCVKSIRKQIAEILACGFKNSSIEEIVNSNKELLNG